MHRTPPIPARLGLIAGVCALLLYAVTGARGVEWQDPGVHQYRILTGQLEHPMGLALSHPLHYWLGRAALHAPGDPLRALNLLSGVCGAVGVGVLAGVIAALTRSALAALLAAAALAFSHAYWQMSALTETYTLAAALMTIEWALLLRYVRTRHPAWLVGVLAVNGLHVADHLLGLLTLVTYSVFLLERLSRRRIRPTWVAIALIAWLAAAAPYWTLVVSHFQHAGDLRATLHSAFFGGSGRQPGWASEVLNVHLSAKQLGLTALTFGYCFPSLAGVVAVAGLFRRSRGPRRVFRRILLAQTVIICAFVGRYPIADSYTYFVPVCALTALWFGWGAPAVLRWCRSARARRRIAALLVGSAALPVVVYGVFPLVAEREHWLSRQMRHIPYRNEYTHFFRPWRFLDDSATRFARAALTQAGPDAWIIANSTTAFPIAATWLTESRSNAQRIFAARACLSEPGRPDLTDEELLARVRSGQPVFAFWTMEVKDVVRDPLVAEEGQPLSRVRLKREP